jgi:hypothetical protein
MEYPRKMFSPPGRRTAKENDSEANKAEGSTGGGEYREFECIEG